MAANGADIAAIDICGFVSTASNAKPATEEDPEETARQIRQLGRQCTPIKADIRDLDALRKAADQIEHAHGHIDIVVADAAIQRVGWLQPQDVSPAAVFLASDAAAMVTGAEYEVTGGDSAKDI